MRRGTTPMMDGASSLRTSVEVLICVTCRRAATLGESSTDTDVERPGARLLERIRAMETPDGLEVRAVECLSNCERGCTIALRGPGRWTYVYGNLDPDADPAVVLEGASRYRDAADGLVPWRERPVHFRKNCIARIPPMEPTND